MCLNFTANCFVFRRKNCKNAPRILYKLCKQGISKMCLNFPCCDLRVALIVKIWPVHFGKIMKLCLVKFRPNLQVPILKIFVGWFLKKCHFFQLRGTHCIYTEHYCACTDIFSVHSLCAFFFCTMWKPSTKCVCTEP